MRTRVLTVLVVVYVLNLVDRNLMSILLDPIKRDLGVSDSLMGLLVGPAFAVLYTLAGIPIARLADRHARRVVLAVGLLVWSLATAASGLARSYVQMALARIAVGVGEASASPCAYSMISDVFSPARRSSAIAIYNSGASIGIFAGMALGGLLNDTLGWRNAFLVVGLPGAVFALVVRFWLPEPRRGAADALEDAGAAPALAEVLRYLLRLRSFRHVLAAAGLYSITSYAMITWSPAFLQRVFDLSPGEFGTQLGLAIGVAGVVGALTAGFLADALTRRDARWLVWIAACGGVAVLPFLVAFAASPSAMLALLVFVPANFFNAWFPSVTQAVGQGLARLRMRALASAIVLFAINIIGLGLGPWLIGISNDLLAPTFGAEAIRYSLGGVGAVNLWAAAHSLLAARHLRAELARAREAGDSHPGCAPSPGDARS
jgi:predicted MFS family arabinose efflux permease